MSLSRLRRSLKRGMAEVLTVGGLDTMIRARHKLLPLVISHHRVLPKSAWTPENIPPMLLSPEAFEQELLWLGKHYRFVAPGEIDRAASTNGHKPAAAITFDDGYQDVYEHAFPILRKHGIPATLFVVTDFVENAKVPLHDQLFVLLSAVWRRYDEPRRVLAAVQRRAGIEPGLLADRRDVLGLLDGALNRLAQGDVRAIVNELRECVDVPDEVWRQFRPVSWEMLHEMRRNGFTIGAHTRTHVLLPNESNAVVRKETLGARRILQERLGEPADMFAYPGGRFDARTVNAVRDAGYRLAFTCCTHRNEAHPRLTIPRKLIWQNCCLDGAGRFSPALATCQAGRVFDRLRPCRQDHQLRARASGRRPIEGRPVQGALANSADGP